ncbi:MAG: hypothetical protein MZV70_18195 [Desulfobacterales bacterium]|nr:hypothetical protein [Desulfobacterales bacterium]
MRFDRFTIKSQEVIQKAQVTGGPVRKPADRARAPAGRHAGRPGRHRRVAMLRKLGAAPEATRRRDRCVASNACPR